ncbi:unnamed protein product [Nesidiocoris tenuis]|uniref:Small acidic protein-like domain-containing protein n=1 Tax=Nesidiocoris tenuis TaxID=355587 RepID=A0A6H5FUV4_9HEMI|nr:unnamed protein product [Nesidiocoris tenuis]
MDTLQYVYSSTSSESGDELETASTTIAPKEIVSSSRSRTEAAKEPSAMDTHQFVYSSTSSSDSADELETASTTISPKDAHSSAENTSRRTSRSPSAGGRRRSADKNVEDRGRRRSPDSTRKEQRRSSDRRSPAGRRSPHYSHKDRRRSRDRDRKHGRDRNWHHRDRSRTRRRSRDRRHSYDRRSRSRSRRRSSYRGDSPKKRSKDRSRSPPFYPPRKHFDPKNKLAILTKMGIDYKCTETGDPMPNRNHGFVSALGAGGSGGNNSGSSADGGSINPPIVPTYYNPLTINAGKYAEQIAKRKMLWNNKKKEEVGEGPKTSSVWQGAKFLQDSDGKMTAKFQRLMGMKETQDVASVAEKGQELIKKQEELFSTMEMQYEVARATTHTQRGNDFLQ